MARMLRVGADDAPSMAPFLARLAWAYGTTTVAADWQRRRGSWSLKVNGVEVARPVTIREINQWWRRNGDDLRAGTHEAQLRPRAVTYTATITSEPKPLPPPPDDELERLRRP